MTVTRADKNQQFDGVASVLVGEQTVQVDVTAPTVMSQLHQQARDILAQVPGAIAQNTTYIASTPNAAAVTAASKVLAQQNIVLMQCVDKLIRLVLNLDGAADLLVENNI